MQDRQTEILQLLADHRSGDEEALDRLHDLLYDDLRAIAHGHLASQPDGHTLNTTALVHESYVKLSAGESGNARDRAHFLAVASRAMRHILIDYARRRTAQKRGGERVRVELEESFAAKRNRTEDLLSLNEALSRLGERFQRLERVVVYRFFGGMTVEETATALEVSRRTVERDWTRAKAYLHRALDPEANHGTGV